MTPLTNHGGAADGSAPRPPDRAARAASKTGPAAVVALSLLCGASIASADGDSHGNGAPQLRQFIDQQVGGIDNQRERQHVDALSDALPQHAGTGFNRRPRREHVIDENDTLSFYGAPVFFRHAKGSGHIGAALHR